jgi:hypothetical protein
MIKLDGIEFDIEEKETEKLKEILARHKELCFTITKKFSIAKLIERKLLAVQKDFNSVNQEINKLKQEQTELETFLGRKAKASVIVKRNIYQIMKKLSAMDEDSKIKYLLSHNKDAEIFLTCNFDNLINHGPNEVRELEQTEEQEKEELELMRKELEEETEQTKQLTRKAENWDTEN